MCCCCDVLVRMFYPLGSMHAVRRQSEGSLIAEASTITHVLEPTYGQAESQRDT